MESKYFLNSEVSRICRISGRQVISWTEKGLVVPFEESRGVGKKRLYDYVNLLEFAFCDALLNDIGMGFRVVKRISSHLRERGLIAAWATNFEGFHKNLYEERKKQLEGALESKKNHSDEYTYLNEIYRKFLECGHIPQKPMGVLVYFLGSEYESIEVIPWEMSYVVNLDIIKKGFEKNRFCFLLDIGAIKQVIDKRL